MAVENKTPGTGTLKKGFRVGDVTHYAFAVREGDMSDYFAAEQIASVENALTFDAALLCQRLIKIGTFEGPFTLKLLGRIKPNDFQRLRNAMREVDAEGESEPAAAPVG